MPHGNGLILTLTAGLVVAFLFGSVAARLRLPVVVGYLLAGVLLGPFTPGFTGDRQIVSELAEIGVMLLMFGVGIHFSLRQLLAVRSLALPGAVGQIAAATLLGIGVGYAWGWGLGGGLVLGLVLSVASTVVLLRALIARGVLESPHGRVAVGWLIVEDLFTVLVLVLLPALAALVGAQPTTADHVSHAAPTAGNVFVDLLLALGKTAFFVLLMVLLGTRVFPWLLARVARLGSRELFTLGVLALALGVAVGAALLLGVSLALGAFLAGVVISESDQSYQAAAEALPLQDAFAVLFFVSVGMLFNPAILLQAPERVLAVTAIIMVGKAISGFLLVALLGGPVSTGLTVAAGLAQIGEFSFIVARLGRQLGLLPEQGYQLVLAGALLSIALNPLLFRTIDPIERWIRRRPQLLSLLEWRTRSLEMGAPTVPSELQGHAIICGYGRVGSLIGRLLECRDIPYVVIEQNQRLVEELREQGIRAYFGDAANPQLLEHLHLRQARALVLAIPDAVATRRAYEFAREMQPGLEIIARTHSEAEWLYLRERADEVILGEREAALEMARSTLERFGLSRDEVEKIGQELRGQVEMDQWVAGRLRVTPEPVRAPRRHVRRRVQRKGARPWQHS